MKMNLLFLIVLISTSVHASELIISCEATPRKVKNCNLYVPNGTGYDVLKENGFNVIHTDDILLSLESNEVFTHYSFKKELEIGDLYLRMSGKVFFNIIGWIQPNSIVQILEKTEIQVSPEPSDYNILATHFHKKPVAMPYNTMFGLKNLPHCRE